MKKFPVFRWLLVAALVAPMITAQSALGHGTGGGHGTGSSGPGTSSGQGTATGHGTAAGHGTSAGQAKGAHQAVLPQRSLKETGDTRFGHEDHFFHNHRRFSTGFDFAGFSLPYWWYPYDWGYPYAYASYDYRYWQNLAMRVQAELARDGYYRGPIDGVIGPASRQAIRAFQEAQGLPDTGLIDPKVLRALKLPVPQVAPRFS